MSGVGKLEAVPDLRALEAEGERLAEERAELERRVALARTNLLRAREHIRISPERPGIGEGLMVGFISGFTFVGFLTCLTNMMR